MSSARRVTITDVAKAAGLSVSTVDRVLNGRAPVRLDTAQRIQDIAESLGFHAAGVIRERVRGKRVRHKLGFLLEHPGLNFHRTLGDALSLATQARPEACEPAQIEFMQDISPEAVSHALVALAARVDAVAIVAADHALIGAEIERLKAQGVPVFALISDLSSPARAGYAGLDNRRVGRTAAWVTTRLAREPGKLAIFVGSHRFQCQELAEMSFRSYVREARRGRQTRTAATPPRDRRCLCRRRRHRRRAARPARATRGGRAAGDRRGARAHGQHARRAAAR
jgi:LacI family transcriptional regulator